METITELLARHKNLSLLGEDVSEIEKTIIPLLPTLPNEDLVVVIRYPGFRLFETQFAISREAEARVIESLPKPQPKPTPSDEQYIAVDSVEEYCRVGMMKHEVRAAKLRGSLGWVRSSPWGDGGGWLTHPVSVVGGEDLWQVMDCKGHTLCICKKETAVWLHLFLNKFEDSNNLDVDRAGYCNRIAREIIDGNAAAGGSWDEFIA